MKASDLFIKCLEEESQWDSTATCAQGEKVQFQGLPSRICWLILFFKSNK